MNFTKRTESYVEITINDYDTVGWQAVQTTHYINEKIIDDNDATILCQKYRGHRFRLYDITTIIADEKEYTGQPENYSSYRYMTYGELLSPSQVLAKVDPERRSYAAFDEYRKASKNTKYIELNCDDFVELTNKDTLAYRMKDCSLLWPKQTSKVKNG